MMECPATESLLLEDFGQKVDLTRRIREVLLNYPEGTTVLKELIQNADDAGATEVCLCLDRRVHGVESLLSNKLAEWQGPALLAYNNAEFTEDDFVSISRIGGSSKQGQAWKTGRFGVGFNSVYHLTDLPSFVSGKYVVVFDPQGIYLPNVSTSNPGKRIEFVTSSAISMYLDQFFPYCAFGCDMRRAFHGTLFRFPLRKTDQAAISKLSRQAYSEDDIYAMFDHLYAEGVLTLLFLKSVQSVEMYVWDVGEPKPRKLYSCSVKSVNEDTIRHRQALLRLSKSINIVDEEMDAFLLEFLSEKLIMNHHERRVDTFCIVQTMAASSSRIGSFASSASREYGIHLLPWASVAACVSENLADDDVLKVGRAFCFLPLPVRTGMTVQVNGYFEVSSNRRGIWYGDDMDRSGKIRSVWNRLLLEDIVAPSFIQLLIFVKDLFGPTSSYYSLWPSGSFDEPWSSLVKQIYKNINNSPVFHSEIEGGKWLLPSEAFLHDEKFSQNIELREALVHVQMPIVHLPNQLFKMILKYSSESNSPQKLVTPCTVRNFLRECNSLIPLSRSFKLLLLGYCLEDLIDADVGKHAKNIPLIPLANGSFGLFSEPSKGISYFICNDMEHKLLQQFHHRVIDQDIPPYIRSRLLEIAMSSAANLIVFDVYYLIQLFPKFVPPDWKYKSKVFWDPESNCSHPTSSWFVLFWQYIGSKGDILSSFDDWPILPSASGHLYRASRNSKLINVEKLPDKMKVILGKIGCKILSCNYGVQDADLSLYIMDANASGVLESMFDVFSSNSGGIQTIFHNLEAEQRDEIRRFLLDPKWYIADSMANSDIERCKKLPIYKVHNEEYSDLDNPRKYLPPLHSPSFLLGREFIKSFSNSEEEILLKYFRVERMGKTYFYKQQVLNRVEELQAEVRDSIMLAVLHDLPQLCVEDASFRGILKDLAFIPTLGGTLKCPKELYDPRNEELRALLDDSDNFPFGVFQEPGILDMLQGLGLRTFVSPETIMESARQIERLMHEHPQLAHSRGKVLLSYLEVNATKWLLDSPDYLGQQRVKTLSRFRPRSSKSDFEKFWHDLRTISWCPVLVSAPFPTLPWPLVTSMVAPPKLVRLKAEMWLVSASMRILDGQCSFAALSDHLGWSSPPSGSVIAAQLLELGKNNEILDDQVFRQELALAMPRLYSILMAKIGSDEMDIVKAVLEGCRWVWVGDGFATADEVVLSGPLHLVPYIRVIPIDLAVFEELFLELGVQKSLKPADYANILCRMATKKGSTPLDGQEISAAILILQHLAEVQFHEQGFKLYLPDVSGRLFRATDLVYNDAPWLLTSEDADAPFGNAALNAKRIVQKFVHRNISNDVAEKLGVCSLRRIMLAQSADSMNLTLSGAAEAFGQHEALTTRLKHILEMYADGPGILFELLQNAEDAGASEVTFLLDKTHYGTSSVLSPEMADWQGPALYCFNNSVFSPQDLYAISRIGQESKLEKPFAIGRFGLGFNCVYHLTDIPSFVSGENIVMFDPHACNLPGISPSHPGLRINFVGRMMMEQFPDQFSPFLHFGCDLRHPFPGTLFRFPLRSAAVACRSLIKKEGYSPEDVFSLLSSFSEVVSQALVFLRNVKTISIFVKEGAKHEMQLLHLVENHCIVEPEAEHNGPHHQLFSFIHGNKQSGLNIDTDQFLNKISKTSGRDLPWKCNKTVVTEHTPSGKKSNLWITSECLDRGRAKANFSASGDNKSHKFIPWACVAANLYAFDNNDEPHVSKADLTAERRNFEGRAFCFLPLPISTGLPVHVNAYFELSSNRRDIWYGNDMAGGGKKRSEWNIYLLEDVAAPAYGHLLEKLAVEVGPCDLYFSFWPMTTGVEPWVSMVRKLYSFIADSDFHVLYTKARGGQWISTKQAIFPDFTFYKATDLVEALSDAGLPLVNVSESLVQRFMEVSPSFHFLTPQLLRTLLVRRNRGYKDRNAMILILEYCLLDFSSPFQSDGLNNLPLVPLANGLFTKFEKRGMGERIYIICGDDNSLLKDSLPHKLVDPGIPEGIHKKLCKIAENGNSNIYFLTSQLLENLFLQLLPTEWQHAKRVNWAHPGQQGQPSVEWITLLWSYLNLSCSDLSIFSKWPILPVEQNYLLQLVENSNVIIDDGWSENMHALLLKLGCLFLRRDLPIKHPQLEKYVQKPTATGILNALLAVDVKVEHIEELFRFASEGELHELRSFILQSKWFCKNQMDDRHIDMIKHLPIFESFKSRKRISLSKPEKCIKPGGVREELLNDDFVRTETEKEIIILKRYLGIREPSRADFYKDFVFSHMSDFLSRQGALSAILCEVKPLIKEDVLVKNALAATPCVSAANGSWQQPRRLYDPRDPKLQKVLHKEAFFPSEEFSDPEVLETLVELGLRTTLGFSGLLDSAKSVSMLHDSNDSEAFSFGRRLLVLLNILAIKLSSEGGEVNFVDKCRSANVISHDKANDEELDADSIIESLDDLQPEEFWSELKSIAWCPVLNNSPIPGLPWLRSSDKVAAPKFVRPRTQVWMVSSSMHILEGEFTSTPLQRNLGWMDNPSINVLSKQLIDLSKSYGQLKLHSELEHCFEDGLQKGILSLYSIMKEYIGTDDFTILKSTLDGVSWVWIGDDFVSSKSLAMDSPVKFRPYLYVVPSELTEFRELLLALGVRLNFDMLDYIHVLQRLQNDVKGSPLSDEQLRFVHCVLEAVADCYSDKPAEGSCTTLLIPDSSGVLMFIGDLVFNDAPWMENTTVFAGKHFVHSSISNDLADRLGVQSLRSLSLIDEEMTKELPCMDYGRINELLGTYGNIGFLIFDLLELADCCKATKLSLIFDKREHPRESLLQQNLGEYQGPALVAVLEGATLSREEVSTLQLCPPWRLRGDTLNYGLGLLSCYSISDLPSVVSDGYFYMFDPRGLTLSLPPSHSPTTKMFSLRGTNVIERFSDQFNPLLIGQDVQWLLANCTIIRMPLSPECMKGGIENGSNWIKQIFDNFLEHASRTLLYLKSILQVTLSTWEEEKLEPCQDFSVYVDSSSANLRNPFSEKKWRKFQISRLFGGSNAATKLQVIDVHLHQGETRSVDKWLVVLSLGSGQTRNMALDRRYLAYNLTPIAGVAACISHDGRPADVQISNSILSCLPLSGNIKLPVTVLGCFLVCHNKGRYLFKFQDNQGQFDAGNQLIEAWNRELMSCVCHSYIELVTEIHKLRRESSTSALDTVRAVSPTLKAYGDKLYSFWPTSNGHLSKNPSMEGFNKADWDCLIERVIRPFYARVAEVPVWQLYSGNLVKAEEGMFLSQPGNGVGGNLLPATVCAFVKEHYPVFSVPWQLVTEIQAVGVSVREVKPKMVRYLLRDASTSIFLRSVDSYVDVLEYCLSDIQLSKSNNLSGGDDTLMDVDVINSDSIYRARKEESRSSSSGDALEMMTNLGKALVDFGRGVVEDIGRTGGELTENGNSSNRDADSKRLLSIASEVKGLPCPTATKHLTRLGVTELWVGNKDQQKLMVSLAAKFVHPNVLDRSVLADILSNSTLQTLLRLKSFSLHLLANHMRLLFHENWVLHVMDSNLAPWFSWENSNPTSSGGEGGPSPEWIILFWKSICVSSDSLSLFSDWPLIPAFIGRPVLCRVKERHLVFVPPPVVRDLNNASESEAVDSYTAFKEVENRYPWLFSVLNQCNIPIFDTAFMDCAVPCNCFPISIHSLGQVIASKLVAVKRVGYFPETFSFSNSNCDEFFTLLASDFASHGSNYVREELEILRALPIYKTVAGSYTRLLNQDLCLISSRSFLKPYNDCCLFHSVESSVETLFLKALGVPELHDQQILVKFGLPGFEGKPQPEKEDILIYIYMNWQDVQTDSTIIEALKETRFVRNADEFSTDISKPRDLYDPADALLTSVFSSERKKFPGERFSTDGWLRILRKLGLRSSIEADVVLECAKRIEFLYLESIKSMGNSMNEFDETYLSVSSPDEVSSELWSLAGSFVEAVFSNFAVLYGNNFCNRLGSIVCIPSEKGYPNIGGKKVLCSYSEAILLKDWPLASSCAPILSKQNVVPPEYSWGALHLRSPPPFSTVLKHLKILGRNGGEDILAHWSTVSGMMTIVEASSEVLKYLDRIWGSLSSLDIAELQTVAFLPAANGTRLVTANSLFVRLTINLSPFAFELPSLYLPFVKILKNLGLQDSLSVEGAKDLLFNLQKACGYQRLNPNELRAVMEILNFICKEAAESNGSQWASEIIVPDDVCRLVHAKSCVYIDSYGSRIVTCIDTYKLRFVHPDLPQRLCTALGIKRLCDVVIEELDVGKQLENLEFIGSVPLPAIKGKLLSRSFQRAVWTIANCAASHIPSFKNLSLVNVESCLESLAKGLQFVQRLYTRFFLLPDSSDITRVAKQSLFPECVGGSEYRTLYFVNRSRTRYLVAEPPTYMSVVDVIAVLVSQVLGSPTPLLIGPLFLCPEDSETAVLDILKLGSNSTATELTGGSNGLVGKEILPQDALLVQFHPLRPFYKGEIVAWRYQNGEKLKYGRVPEDVGPLAGQALYRFNVETSLGITDPLLSSQIFSFRSILTDKETSSAPLLEGSHSFVDNRTWVEVPESSGRGKTNSQLSKDLEYGRVPSKELVLAVHEMLSAAGINMDVEKQSLLQTTLTLKEKLEESQAAFLLEQEKADAATKEADTAKAAWLCRVCLSAEVDITLVPCGHVLCHRCSTAVSRCPFCRLQVAKTLRIFRP